MTGALRASYSDPQGERHKGERFDRIMISIVAEDALALQRLYHWERTAPNQVAQTQPMGDGKVRDYT
jgi:hypothetical protein